LVFIDGSDAKMLVGRDYWVLDGSQWPGHSSCGGIQREQ
jgi:hypothetical protein